MYNVAKLSHFMFPLSLKVDVSCLSVEAGTEIIVSSILIVFGGCNHHNHYHHHNPRHDG